MHFPGLFSYSRQQSHFYTQSGTIWKSAAALMEYVLPGQSRISQVEVNEGARPGNNVPLSMRSSPLVQVVDIDPPDVRHRACPRTGLPASVYISSQISPF
ncbi:hypothetical protein ElyMa_004991100 [Elysia marginata]|uniref:Uncharacterized protein n=1 Tax=Elysia marginata TaxID=1093978 RepID=A0AAV4J8I8_9GAST|nr:hypothetical protein ElyMa_004991100 [Elysia marginata]